MATINDALTYILTEASDSDLDRIYDALKRRRRALLDSRALLVRVGDRVTTKDLSPKYLNGLEGTVIHIRGKRADITLDEHSTNAIRGTKHGPSSDSEVTKYTLRGCPLGTLVVKS